MIQLLLAEPRASRYAAVVIEDHAVRRRQLELHHACAHAHRLPLPVAKSRAAHALTHHIGSIKDLLDALPTALRLVILFERIHQASHAIHPAAEQIIGQTVGRIHAKKHHYTENGDDRDQNHG